VRGTADAGMRISDAARVGARFGDHVGQRLEARGRWHGNAERLARGARQIREVGARIELQHAELREARD